MASTLQDRMTEAAADMGKRFNRADLQRAANVTRVTVSQWFTGRISSLTGTRRASACPCGIVDLTAWLVGYTFPSARPHRPNAVPSETGPRPGRGGHEGRPMNAANLCDPRVASSDRMRRAAQLTLEAHRPWRPDGISLACVQDFLGRLDCLAQADFVAEALSEMEPLDLCAIAEAARTGESAEAGRLVAKAVKVYADNYLGSQYGEMFR
jgi:hypothetical protein